MDMLKSGNMAVSTNDLPTGWIVDPPPVCVPPELAEPFAPATCIFTEWQEYKLRIPGAEALAVGTEQCLPWVDDWFQLRYENHLGLTLLQPMKGGRPFGLPLVAEVISPKFGSPALHLNSYRALLDDLYARAVRIPFFVVGSTARGVSEAHRPPSPLFSYHYLLRYAAEIQAALSIVQATPHRLLADVPERVSLAQVSEVDANVLFSVLHAVEDWQPSRSFPLAAALRGYAPEHILQRLPDETLDTPENRFVRRFVEELLLAAESLPAQPWWGRIDSSRQRTIHDVAVWLRQTLAGPPLQEIGSLSHFPYASQVLLRREGYRQLRVLWEDFQTARRPIFARLQQAIEMRDIATLYEVWVFFALLETISVELHLSPVIDFQSVVLRGLQWGTRARFGDAGELIYNRTWPGYSGPLRPDFTWVRGGRCEVVLDAKFRLEHIDGLDPSDDEETPTTIAKRVDLYKMHTYRDALSARAALCAYPGDESVLYAEDGERSKVSLRQVILSSFRGVGTIAIRPGT